VPRPQLPLQPILAASHGLEVHERLAATAHAALSALNGAAALPADIVSLLRSEGHSAAASVLEAHLPGLLLASPLVSELRDTISILVDAFNLHSQLRRATAVPVGVHRFADVIAALDPLPPSLGLLADARSVSAAFSPPSSGFRSSYSRDNRDTRDTRDYRDYQRSHPYHRSDRVPSPPSSAQGFWVPASLAQQPFLVGSGAQGGANPVLALPAPAAASSGSPRRRPNAPPRSGPSYRGKPGPRGGPRR
jgi:hypothetical protein